MVECGLVEDENVGQGSENEVYDSTKEPVDMSYLSVSTGKDLAMM